MIVDVALLLVFPAAMAMAGAMDLFTMTIPNRISIALLVGFFVLRAAYLRVSQAAVAGELHWSALTTPASFVIGSLASYWMIDRIAGFWA